MGPTEAVHQNLENRDTPASKYQAQFFQDNVDAPIDPNPPSNNMSSNSASQRALRSEALRIATFQGWPLDFMSPRSLSSAGFFYRGIGDQTQCAFCYITISQWEPHDNPLTEHQRHAPNCPFILKLPVGNIPLSGGRAEGSPPSTPSFQLPSFSLPALGRGGLDTCSRFQNEDRPEALPENGKLFSLIIKFVFTNLLFIC